MMHKYGAEYTNTFLVLTFDNPEDTVLFGTMEFDQWHGLWQATKASFQQLMRNNNPALIPGNHRVEEVLEAAVKDKEG